MALFGFIFVATISICVCENEGPFDALYHQLIHGQTRYVRPYNGTNPFLVTVGHYLSNIQNVDSEKGQATLTIREELTWVDPRLLWTPANHSNITSFYVPKNKIFFPDVTFFNTIIKQSTRNTKSPVVNINNKGLVTVLYYMVLTVSTQINVEDFPFDTQTVPIYWGHALAGEDEMDIHVKVRNLAEAKAFGFSAHDTQEWKILSMDCERLTTTYTSAVYNYHPFEKCVLRVQRLFGFYILNFCIPAIIVTFIGITGLHCISALPNQRDSKAGMGLSVLVTLSILALGVSSHLPRSNHVSRLHKLYLLLIGLVLSACLLACAAMLANNRFEAKASHLIKRGRTLSFALHIFGMLLVTSWFFSAM